MPIANGRLARTLVTLVVSGALGLVSSACGSGAKEFSPIEGLGDSGTITGPTTTSTVTVIAAGPCDTGERQACKYNLPAHAGIVSCFHGIQICTDSVWGPCIDGSLDGGTSDAGTN
jgi:hypothetical protein